MCGEVFEWRGVEVMMCLSGKVLKWQSVAVFGFLGRPTAQALRPSPALSGAPSLKLWPHARQALNSLTTTTRTAHASVMQAPIKGYLR